MNFTSRKFAPRLIAEIQHLAKWLVAATILLMACASHSETSTGAHANEVGIDGVADDNAANACGTTFPAGGGGVLNVANYGARPDGSDAYPGIQAAIDAACSQRAASPPSSPPVFLPAGTYSTSKPLYFNCHGIEMFGACRDGVIIQPTFQGPAILANPPGPPVALHLAPPLVGGVGQSLDTEHVAGASNFTLNLRDMPRVELNGLSAFTVETFFKMTSSITGSLISSAACVGSSNCGHPTDADWTLPGFAQAFALTLFGQDVYQTPDQRIQAALNVGGTRYFLGSPTFSLNDVHHVALSYDGATIRLYLDGAMVASQAATGPIVQDAAEDVTAPGAFLGPTTGLLAVAPPGYIDSMRLSKVARYTQPAFQVPKEKLPADTGTLALLNFDAQMPGLVRAYNGTAPFWLPIRRTGGRTTDPIQSFLALPSFHDFTIQGGMGLVGWLATVSQIYHVNCLDCDYGIAMLGNNYEGRLDDVRVTAGGGRGRFGVFSAVANGNEYNHIDVSGQVYPFVIAGGAQTVINNLSVTSGASTVFGAYLSGDFSIVNHPRISAPAASSVWRAAMASVGAWAKLHVIGGTLDHLPNHGVPIVMTGGPPNVAAGVGALIEGTSFTHTATAPELLHIVGPPVLPNVMVGIEKDSPSVALSNDPKVVVGNDVATPPSALDLPVSAPGSDFVRGALDPARVFDITAYGARADGTDAQPAIQAAIDAACAHGGSTVFLPVGTFALRRPVRVACSGLEIAGASANASLLSVSGPAMPAIVMNPPGMTGIDPGPALVGSGASMRTDRGESWLDLRDDVSIDGWPAFTAEAFIAMSALSTGRSGIVQSFGCVGSGGVLPGCTSAFELGTDGPSLVATLTAGGQAHSLRGPALTLGAVHHVALSYDGSRVRLFLDGVDVASEAASGPMNQGIYENFTIGPEVDQFGAVIRYSAMAGRLDSVRISNVARYTTRFTVPTDPPAADVHSYALVDFDLNPPGLTSSWNTLSPIYLPVHRTVEPNGTTVGKLTGTTLRHFGTVNAPIFGMNAVRSRYQHLSSTYSGMILRGSSEDSLFDDIKLGSGGRYGLMTVNGDRSLHHNVSMGLEQVPLAVVGGAGEQFNNLFVWPAPASPFQSYFVRSDDTVVGLYYDLEGSGYDALKAEMVIEGATARFQLFGGELDSAPNGISFPVVIDGGQGALFAGTSFTGLNASLDAIHLNAPICGKNVAMGTINQWSTAAVSNDPALVSIGNGATH